MNISINADNTEELKKATSQLRESLNTNAILLTLSEKGKFLQEAADNQYILFLEHDNYNECCTVKHTEKGVRLDEVFRLKDIL